MKKLWLRHAHRMCVQLYALRFFYKACRRNARATEHTWADTYILYCEITSSGVNVEDRATCTATIFARKKRYF